jgi:acyl carrier protein
MDVTFNKLRTILSEKFSFHYDQVQLETQLEFELGMDSRELFELLYELEKNFEITVDFDEIDLLLKNSNILIINDLVDYIKKTQNNFKENLKFSK